MRSWGWLGLGCRLWEAWAPSPRRLRGPRRPRAALLFLQETRRFFRGPPWGRASRPPPPLTGHVICVHPPRRPLSLEVRGR